MSGKRIRTLLGQLGLTQVRLALLTALASYQVDRSVIDKFRLDWPDDATLVELTSWASLAAARRVGGWIPVGTPETDRDTVAVDENA